MTTYYCMTEKVYIQKDKFNTEESTLLHVYGDDVITHEKVFENSSKLWTYSKDGGWMKPSLITPILGSTKFKLNKGVSRLEYCSGSWSGEFSSTHGGYLWHPFTSTFYDELCTRFENARNGLDHITNQPRLESLEFGDSQTINLILFELKCLPLNNVNTDISYFPVFYHGKSPDHGNGINRAIITM